MALRAIEVESKQETEADAGKRNGRSQRTVSRGQLPARLQQRWQCAKQKQAPAPHPPGRSAFRLGSLGTDLWLDSENNSVAH